MTSAPPDGADPVPRVSRRPLATADLPFLEALYAGTRREELAAVPWTDEQKAAFLKQQFTAQHDYYQQHYPSAQFEVLEVDGRPVGRLYVARWPQEIRLMDLALVPQHRRHGIGTALLRELIEEGGRSGRPVTVHVERLNPASRLYERMGFRLKEDKGVYLLLERPPALDPEGRT